MNIIVTYIEVFNLLITLESRIPKGQEYRKLPYLRLFSKIFIDNCLLSEKYKLGRSLSYGGLCYLYRYDQYSIKREELYKFYSILVYGFKLEDPFITKNILDFFCDFFSFCYIGSYGLITQFLESIQFYFSLSPTVEISNQTTIHAIILLSSIININDQFKNSPIFDFSKIVKENNNSSHQIFSKTKSLLEKESIKRENQIFLIKKSKEQQKLVNSELNRQKDLKLEWVNKGIEKEIEKININKIEIREKILNILKIILEKSNKIIKSRTEGENVGKLKKSISNPINTNPKTIVKTVKYGIEATSMALNTCFALCLAELNYKKTNQQIISNCIRLFISYADFYLERISLTANSCLQKLFYYSKQINAINKELLINLFIRICDRILTNIKRIENSFEINLKMKYKKKDREKFVSKSEIELPNYLTFLLKTILVCIVYNPKFFIEKITSDSIFNTISKIFNLLITFCKHVAKNNKNFKNSNSNTNINNTNNSTNNNTNNSNSSNQSKIDDDDEINLIPEDYQKQFYLIQNTLNKLNNGSENSNQNQFIRSCSANNLIRNSNLLGKESQQQKEKQQQKQKQQQKPKKKFKKSFSKNKQSNNEIDQMNKNQINGSQIYNSNCFEETLNLINFILTLWNNYPMGYSSEIVDSKIKEFDDLPKELISPNEKIINKQQKKRKISDSRTNKEILSSILSEKKRYDPISYYKYSKIFASLNSIFIIQELPIENGHRYIRLIMRNPTGKYVWDALFNPNGHKIGDNNGFDIDQKSTKNQNKQGSVNNEKKKIIKKKDNETDNENTIYIRKVGEIPKFKKAVNSTHLDMLNEMLDYLDENKKNDHNENGNENENENENEKNNDDDDDDDDDDDENKNKKRYKGKVKDQTVNEDLTSTESEFEVDYNEKINNNNNNSPQKSQKKGKFGILKIKKGKKKEKRKQLLRQIRNINLNKQRKNWITEKQFVELSNKVENKQTNQKNQLNTNLKKKIKIKNNYQSQLTNDDNDQIEKKLDNGDDNDNDNDDDDEDEDENANELLLNPLNHFQKIPQRQKPIHFSHFCRLLLSQLGFLNQKRKWILLEWNTSLHKLLHELDEKPTRLIHKINVIYVGKGQRKARDILKNQKGSPSFEEFIYSLGCEINIQKHLGYKGDLHENEFFKKNIINTLYYSDFENEIIFNIPSKILNNFENTIEKGNKGEDGDKGDKSANENEKEKNDELKYKNKLKYISNNYLNIIWSEDIKEYDPSIFPSKSHFVTFVIYPLPNGFFRIQIFTKPEIQIFGPIIDGMVLNKRNLSYMIRTSAILTNTFIYKYYKGDYQNPHYVRNNLISEIINQYQISKNFDQYFTHIITTQEPEDDIKCYGNVINKLKII
ncbi:hypothetical protein M0813_27510 [Anaeramoeba flamelloides]|uniref:Rap-GAP domain-containing protein n=1 Tax=Anaeramoeba flamelloides TaxID=1746091 RepID=A0ABQ8XX60_9EUKA|nr:hypothetical protein M0813_27510 [Anaeramoeba flamelloides]